MALMIGAAIFFIVIGGALLAFGVVFLRDANASANWPTTPGRVENVRVTWDNVGSTQAAPERAYSFIVTYSYAVAGEPYAGNRYSLGEGSTATGRRFPSEEAARNAAAAAYRSGQDVTVYYDPADPAQAVLQPGVNWGTYVPLILGAFFLLCGAGLLRPVLGVRPRQ
jgi:hypothetical protein